MNRTHATISSAKLKRTPTFRSHPKLLIVFVVVRVLVAQTLQPIKLLALH